jgi:hypothetical protein
MFRLSDAIASLVRYFSLPTLPYSPRRMPLACHKMPKKKEEEIVARKFPAFAILGLPYSFQLQNAKTLLKLRAVIRLYVRTLCCHAL